MSINPVFRSKGSKLPSIMGEKKDVSEYVQRLLNYLQEPDKVCQLLPHKTKSCIITVIYIIRETSSST